MIVLGSTNSDRWSEQRRECAQCAVGGGADVGGRADCQEQRDGHVQAGLCLHAPTGLQIRALCATPHRRGASLVKELCLFRIWSLEVVCLNTLPERDLLGPSMCSLC